ncbi:hypothetical protein A0H76_2864 [Hepatospora eriocheir]|uniref:Uncharacterized protein n=1 Tax=Hepatospora eriocheir TaxID=1081669 RepID=A0A1X0Q5D7_9MICR|nr:hypothetical protein A0H76_2864 [Hepatospora eriocheir]
MTLMPSENKLEEIHNWYLSLLGVYRKLFGEFEVSFSSNKCEMTIFNKVYEYSVKLIIENNKLQQIVFINIPESMLQVYNEVREWCIRLNDSRLIMHFLTNLEGLI